MLSRPVRLSWEEGGTLFILPFDACMIETHDLSSELTRHPVETGRSINDHIIENPDRVSLSVVFSNTPLLKLSDALSPNSPMNTRGAVTLGSPTVLKERRAEALFEELNRLRTDRVLVTLHANLRTYEDMAIARVNVPRDAERGNSVFIDLDLERVTLADSLQVEVPPLASGTETKGKQPTKPADPPQQQQYQSTLSSWTGVGA